LVVLFSKVDKDKDLMIMISLYCRNQLNR